MEEFLKEFYFEDINDLINSVKLQSIKVDLTVLQNNNNDLFNELLKNTRKEHAIWNNCLLEVQKTLINENILNNKNLIKRNACVRFVNLQTNTTDKQDFWPNIKDYSNFVQIKATIVRIGKTTIKEIKREYECNKCKKVVTIEAEFERMYSFNNVYKCNICKNIIHSRQASPIREYCIDYQEIVIQEIFYKKKPSTLIVTLENDLADSCQLGDCVTLCGTVERRWKIFREGVRSIITLTLKAISITPEKKNSSILQTPEGLQTIRDNFQDTIKKSGEYVARNLLLKSFCPSIYGLDLVKLAVALSLCSSFERNNEVTSDITTRTDSHLFLVGDPGMAKSKLLKAASNIACKSIHTQGTGCTSAGLTAAAIKEDGEWHLEAGALVLADRGICCIDEFNLMREPDKVALHEAMEQQRISVAKAGLVCQLRTRCVIIAATNPKVVYSNSINIGVKTPLLSRFDLVFVLNDYPSEKWDAKVVDHIANQIFPEDNHNELWDLNKLQCHFMAARKITTEMTAGAQTVLGTYYKLCRNDPMREPSRTSVRLYESLVRLANSHARLLFRNKVTISDAIMVVRLIESSYGFGRIIEPTDIIKDFIPFSDDDSDNKILERLQLKGLNLIKIERERDLINLVNNSNKQKKLEKHEINSETSLDVKLHDKQEIKKPENSSNKTTNYLPYVSQYLIDEDVDLDELLNLDFLDNKIDEIFKKSELNDKNNKHQLESHSKPTTKDKNSIENSANSSPSCSSTLDILKPGDVQKKFAFKRKKLITTENKSEDLTEENCVKSNLKENVIVNVESSNDEIIPEKKQRKYLDVFDCDDLFADSEKEEEKEEELDLDVLLNLDFLK